MSEELGKAVLEFLKSHPEKYSPEDIEKMLKPAPKTKATLEFDLMDIDSKKEFEACVKAVDFKLALWEIKHNLFRTVERELGVNENADVYDLFQQKIGEIFEDFNITSEDLD